MVIAREGITAGQSARERLCSHFRGWVLAENNNSIGNSKGVILENNIQGTLISTYFTSSFENHKKFI